MKVKSYDFRRRNDAPTKNDDELLWPFYSPTGRLNYEHMEMMCRRAAEESGVSRKTVYIYCTRFRPEHLMDFDGLFKEIHNLPVIFTLSTGILRLLTTPNLTMPVSQNWRPILELSSHIPDSDASLDEENKHIYRSSSL